MDKLTSRNISLAAIFLVALIIVLVLRDKTPFGSGQASFASAPGTEITRIEFSGEGKKLVLERKENSWTVNGKEQARSGGIAFLEAVLTGMKIKSPVSPDLFQVEAAQRKDDPVRVRVYEKRKMLASFLVYKTSSNIYGNFMKTGERTKPFIVHLPGFEGDIGSLFTLNELYWLPYKVFNLLPSEISEVRFENLSDTASSFAINRGMNLFFLSDGRKVLAGWDTSRVRRYISYFTLVPFESWALSLPEQDAFSIKAEVPLCRIHVRKTDGAGITLT
ncbi:MAG: hypothetical protein MUE74_12050, partial [Bacteroidales bacterium]|nr:hypothetical protein [Bacteroidales bacterium]